MNVREEEKHKPQLSNPESKTSNIESKTSNIESKTSNIESRASNSEKWIMVRLRGKVPREFFWKGRWRWVSAIEDEWVDTGEWWKGEGEKTFYRVASGSQVYELYHDVNENVWVIYRVYD